MDSWLTCSQLHLISTLESRQSKADAIRAIPVWTFPSLSVCLCLTFHFSDCSYIWIQFLLPYYAQLFDCVQLCPLSSLQCWFASYYSMKSSTMHSNVLEDTRAVNCIYYIQNILFKINYCWASQIQGLGFIHKFGLLSVWISSHFNMYFLQVLWFPPMSLKQVSRWSAPSDFCLVFPG